jgi:quercetin dioxygenase-like cupin family protein
MTFAKLSSTFAVSAAALFVCGSLAQAAPASVGKEVMRKDLLAAPDKEVVMSTVEYPPGGGSPSHRHDAQVFVYVLEGHVNMQVKGGPLLTLGPGETFYESPTDIHVVSANASKTEPAKILAILIKDKGKPSTRQAAPDGSH